jgi:hypothetical protein
MDGELVGYTAVSSVFLRVLRIFDDVRFLNSDALRIRMRICVRPRSEFGNYFLAERCVPSLQKFLSL